jgi:hypothetical protein
MVGGGGGGGGGATCPDTNLIKGSQFDGNSKIEQGLPFDIKPTKNSD